MHFLNDSAPQKRMQTLNELISWLSKIVDFVSEILLRRQESTVFLYFVSFLSIVKLLIWRILAHSPEQCAASFSFICEVVVINQIVVNHPPFSSDVALCDFYIFQTVKSELKRSSFQSIELVKAKEALTLKNFIYKKKTSSTAAKKLG